MKNINRLDLIIALYIFGVVAAELMGSKTFPLISFSWLHLTAPVAVFVTPMVFTLLDSVVEVYGRQRARSLVYSGLVVIFLVITYTALATHLRPSARFSSMESAYDTIFEYSIRIAAASLVTFAVSELLDVAIFSKLRKKLNNRALWLRNNITNFVSQFADTAFFLTLAFYSLHDSLSSNTTFLLGLIIPYWLIRCTLSAVETPLVYLGVWWLRGSMNPKGKVKA